MEVESFFSAESINRRRAAFRAQVRNIQGELNGRLEMVCEELVQFLQASANRGGSGSSKRGVVRPRSVVAAVSSGNSASGSGAFPRSAYSNSASASGSPTSMSPVANFADVGSDQTVEIDEHLSLLAGSNLQCAVREAFDNLLEQIPLVDTSETWERESLLRRLSLLREQVRVLKLEISRQREDYLFLVEKHSKLHKFTQGVKSTLWLTLAAAVQELHGRGDHNTALTIMQKFSDEWPDAAASADEITALLRQTEARAQRVLTNSEDADDAVKQMIAKQVEVVRKEEELKRGALEAQYRELEGSIPHRIAEAIRHSQETSKSDAALFQRLKCEYENKIDELNDLVETMKLDAEKRVADTKALILQFYGSTGGGGGSGASPSSQRSQDAFALNSLEKNYSESILKQEQLKLDLLKQKMESKLEQQALNRTLKAANQKLAKVRPEEVVRREACAPLEAQISELQRTCALLNERLEAIKRESQREQEMFEQRSTEMSKMNAFSQKLLENSKKENMALISTNEKHQATIVKLQEKLTGALADNMALQQSLEKQTAYVRSLAAKGGAATTIQGGNMPCDDTVSSAASTDGAALLSPSGESKRTKSFTGKNAPPLLAAAARSKSLSGASALTRIDNDGPANNNIGDGIVEIATSGVMIKDKQQSSNSLKESPRKSVALLGAQVVAAAAAKFRARQEKMKHRKSSTSTIASPEGSGDAGSSAVGAVGDHDGIPPSSDEAAAGSSLLGATPLAAGAETHRLPRPPLQVLSEMVLTAARLGKTTAAGGVGGSQSDLTCGSPRQQLSSLSATTSSTLLSPKPLRSSMADRSHHPSSIDLVRLLIEAAALAMPPAAESISLSAKKLSRPKAPQESGNNIGESVATQTPSVWSAVVGSTSPEDSVTMLLMNRMLQSCAACCLCHTHTMECHAKGLMKACLRATNTVTIQSASSVLTTAPMSLGDARHSTSAGKRIGQPAPPPGEPKALLRPMSSPQQRPGVVGVGGASGTAIVSPRSAQLYQKRPMSGRTFSRQVSTGGPSVPQVHSVSVRDISLVPARLLGYAIGEMGGEEGVDEGVGASAVDECD